MVNSQDNWIAGDNQRTSLNWDNQITIDSQIAPVNLTKDN